MRRRDFYRRHNEEATRSEKQADIIQSTVKEKLPDRKDASTNGEVLKAGILGCPKCGRIIRRGRYFHEKYCKGDLPGPRVDA